LGPKFTVHTDHKNLLQLHTLVGNTRRLAAWANKLSEYDITIKFRAGVNNTPADFVSRHPVRESTAPVISMETGSRSGTVAIVQEPQPESKSKSGAGVEHMADMAAAIDGVEAVGTFTTPEQSGHTNGTALHHQVVEDVAAFMVGNKVTRPPRLPTIAWLLTEQTASSDWNPMLQVVRRRCREKDELYREVKLLRDKQKRSRSESEQKWLQLVREARSYSLNRAGLLCLTGQPNSKFLSRTDEGSSRFDGLTTRDMMRIVVPQACRNSVIWHAHDAPLAVHLGAHHTAAAILASFWWPTLLEDVKHWTNTCLRCKLAKQTRRHRHRDLGFSYPAQRPFDTVAMDLVHVAGGGNIGAESLLGHTHVLTCTDQLTGFLVMEPIRLETGAEPMTWAYTCARAFFVRVWLQLHRRPRVLLTDQGAEFDNTLFRRLAELTGTKLARTSTLNPQANYDERHHRGMGAAWKVFCNGQTVKANPKAWHEYVAMFEHRMNQRNIPGTSLSPARVVLAVDSNLPVFDRITTWSKDTGDVDFARSADAMVKMLEDSWEFLRVEKFFDAQQRVNQWRKSHKAPMFVEGDYVILQRKQIGKRAAGTATHLLLQWSGPHKVVAQPRSRSQTYTIQHCDTGKLHRCPAHLLAPVSAHIEARFQADIYKHYGYEMEAWKLPLGRNDLVIVHTLPPDMWKRLKSGGLNRQTIYVAEVMSVSAANTGSKASVIVHLYGTAGFSNGHKLVDGGEVSHRPIYSKIDQGSQGKEIFKCFASTTIAAAEWAAVKLEIPLVYVVPVLLPGGLTKANKLRKKEKAFATRYLDARLKTVDTDFWDDQDNSE